MKQVCLVCKKHEVHVNYEFDGGSGFCGPLCEDKWFKIQMDYQDLRGAEYDDMFSDAMELDPSDRI